MCLREKVTWQTGRQMTPPGDSPRRPPICAPPPGRFVYINRSILSPPRQENPRVKLSSSVPAAAALLGGLACLPFPAAAPAGPPPPPPATPPPPPPPPPPPQRPHTHAPAAHHPRPQGSFPPRG